MSDFSLSPNSGKKTLNEKVLQKRPMDGRSSMLVINTHLSRVMKTAQVLEAQGALVSEGSSLNHLIQERKG